MCRAARERRHFRQSNGRDLSGLSCAEIGIKRTGRGRIATPFGKGFHAPDADPAVQRHCEDIADLERMAWRINRPAVDPDASAADKVGGTRSCPDKAHVPEPFVETLAVCAG